jgi:hypothetical protein
MKFVIYLKIIFFTMSFKFSFFRTPKTIDTGLRGTTEGRLYVDKSVFYNRKEVRDTIQKLKESLIIQEQIAANRM